MRDKEARIEIEGLTARVELLSKALTSALQSVSRLQDLGAKLSSEFVKAAAVMSNVDAYYAAQLEVQGRGLRGYAALEVFNAARDAHKAAWPDLHDAAHWRVVPAWMLAPGALAGSSQELPGGEAVVRPQH